MLKFYDYNVTNNLEVPYEVCLNYHIAECQNNCAGCFSPELRETTDILLSDVYEDILMAYSERITCVCFLGEGKNTSDEHKDFKKICEHIHSLGFRTCLYCGRDCSIEEWMYCFDYIKVGSYKPEYGDLSMKTTNQKLFRKIENGYEEITYLFWMEESNEHNNLSQ